MALATCRDCNREVSTLARHCVHCGRPRPTSTGSGSVIAGIAVVVIALALTAGVVCAARRACHKMNAKAAHCRIMSEPRTSEIRWTKDTSPDSLRLVLERNGARVVEIDREKGVMTVDFPLELK